MSDPNIRCNLLKPIKSATDLVLLLLRSTEFMRKNVASSVAFVNTSAIMQLVPTSLHVAISRITAYFTKIVAISKWRERLEDPSLFTRMSVARLSPRIVVGPCTGLPTPDVTMRKYIVDLQHLDISAVSA